MNDRRTMRSHTVDQPRNRAKRGRTPTPTGKTSRPRQAEVAELAGVSQATVSLVLSGRKQGQAITAQTRERVLESARSLGYVPDPAARRLAAARNDLLGVFSFTATFPTDVEHSYYPFLVGVEQEAARLGYDLVLFTGSSSGGAGASAPDRPDYPVGALSRVRLADGCLFIGRHAPSGELKRLISDGFPVVYLGRRDEPEGLRWVGADYVSATGEVVAEMARWGHERVMLLRGNEDDPPSADRQRGFVEGLDASGMTAGPQAVFRTSDPARDVTAEWLRDRLAEGVTAFVVEESDTGAEWRAITTAVRAAGLSCPGDLSLAILGSPPADLDHGPEATGFDVPRAELGAAAVRQLAALIAGEETDTPPVACTFRRGSTAGPAPGRRAAPSV
ncbi:LacI family DNA-binding transcriptional regulator [Streptomyces sp. NPDC058576]|uniref:LacI family DNA-binding transcriptional regulator n=1 Tax=Streptomyces sp. NPDC058576 TaxID=3346547 RepID=UPI00365A87BC